MFNLLTSPGTARKAARIFRTMTDGIRSVIAPVGLVADQAEPATVAPAAEPAGLFTAEEMPTDAEIEAAARTYSRAVEDARRADRSKRAGKKLLTRLPSGIYGSGWKIYRKPSARMTPDLEEIGRILREHGVNEIPMKPVAASLVVERVEVVDTIPAAIEQLAGATV